jgi:dUTP pyrophosphatase|tara:strand:+ start:1449 stop:1883 length:435 start_codon:yes stop_codon:yes gene_type:complete
MQRRNIMNVKIKKLHPDAVVPKYAKQGDAGLDLTAIDVIADGTTLTYKTGLAIEIPPWHVGLLFPRSSVYKTGQTLTNCVGVIDSGYRGEIMLKYTLSPYQREYDIGDRVGQLIIMPYPKIDFVEVEKLTPTDRGDGGYGSTGR